MRSRGGRIGASAVGFVVSAGALGGLTATAGRADITFGGNARSYAMGGAGIALVDHSERNTLVNPAALALYNRRVKVEFPNIGLRASGLPLDKAYDHIIDKPSANDAVTLARDFGQRESDYGVSLNWGVRFGHMDARATGVAQVKVIPNAALQTWAKNANGDLTQLTGLERADLIGAAIYSLPQIGVAERISPAGSPIRVEGGFRVKLERSIYTHYLVDSNNIRNNTDASTAPELNGGTTLTKDGIGVDLGFLAHPSNHKGFSTALVITNLIEPNFRFTGTDTNGSPIKYDLQPRSVSVGSAWEGGRVVTAFDLVDLTRAYGNVQARLGAEYTTHGLSLQAGYASARGFTAGFGFGFLSLAFGAKAPLEITQTMRF